MTIGQVIKTKRLEAGHSQEYLAVKLGVSRQTVSNWENERTIPAADYLRDLSRLYSMSFDTLIGLEVPNDSRRNLLLKYVLLSLLLALLLVSSQESLIFYAHLTVGAILLLFLLDISTFIRKKVVLWKGKKA